MFTPNIPAGRFRSRVQHLTRPNKQGPRVLIEGGHAWRGQAKGIDLNMVQGPDPIAEDKISGLSPGGSLHLDERREVLLSHTTGIKSWSSDPCERHVQQHYLRFARNHVHDKILHPQAGIS